MKKIVISLILFVLLVTGCGKAMDTPTKKVEELLGRYQSMDSEVLSQLDDVISNDTTMNETQKEEYRSLMEKQYQNLSYKIKDEEIDGDNATVLVEIEVYDYISSINKSKDYYKEHKDEFEKEKEEEKKNDTDTSNTPGNDEDENGSVVENAKEAIEDTVEFIDYKIKELQNVTDKTKYEITFHLTRVDDEWKVDDISDIDRQKIHGLYEE